MNEQMFYSALNKVFIGAELEGESGYVNLMNIKSQYYKKIKVFLEDQIDGVVSDLSEKEEVFQKLYTFFNNYFGETGTPFFNSTEIHKNLYEKVYSERKDTMLFWKTEKLYYVKSEANYTSATNLPVDGYFFNFDASELEHQQNNEKKQLEFYLVDIEENKFTFKIKYKAVTNYSNLRNYLELKNTEEIKKHLSENFGLISHSNINEIKNSLRLDLFPISFIKENLKITNNNDTINTVSVEFAPNGEESLKRYLKETEVYIDMDTIVKAFSIYKKQNEIDYFIHKDAKSFLEEQFDLYIYNYLFKELDLYNSWSKERIDFILEIKRIAYQVIDYVSKFEDQLKKIWLKPKFVTKSNYVFSLEKLTENQSVINKIINHDGFGQQVEEWKELQKQWTDKEDNIVKKEWKEFNKALEIDKNNILIKGENEELILNNEYKYLPIDTKYFKDIESEIISSFNNLEEAIDGYLIKSENFQALNTILRKYKDQIDLVYIDPPFNAGDDFLYKDKFQDSTWLTIMENRLSLAKKLLSPQGSLYLHLDDDADYYGRQLTNRIFDEDKFRSQIVYKRSAGHALATGLDVITDNILWYSKGKEYIYNQQYRVLTPEELDEKFPEIEEETSRRYNTDKLEKSSNSSSRGEERNFDGKVVTTNIGWVWTQKKIDEELAKNPYKIYWTRNNRPRYKNYADEYPGMEVNNLWNEIKLISSNSAEAMLFNTQKPEGLLERIINQATNNDSIILDFFLGSGTTIATAHKLSRKWIGVEMGDHFYTKILPRMKKILAGDESGISKNENVAWKGGGLFKYYELEQYENVLRHSKYNPSEEDISNIDFNINEKFLDALEINYEEEKTNIDFTKLYKEVDIAESASNVLGQTIKKIDNSLVYFSNGDILNLNEIDLNDHSYLKALIWW